MGGGDNKMVRLDFAAMFELYKLNLALSKAK